jgi:hypothetical protein
MKKLALASAIAAAAMVSTGAHAWTAHVILPNIPPPNDITIDCALTPWGGTSTMTYDPVNDTLNGTICLAPSGAGNYPYVKLDIGLMSSTGHSGGTHMTGGGIAIYTDTATSTTGWGYISTQPGASILCNGLTGGAISPPPPVLLCVATLLGMPAELWAYP